MKKFDIYIQWKHVEGHIVNDKKNKFPIIAQNESSAIEKFKEDNILTIGKYIFKNDDGKYRYGSFYGFGEFRLIYAKKL